MKKTRNIRRMLAIMLALAMLVGILPMTALAEDEPQDSYDEATVEQLDPEHDDGLTEDLLFDESPESEEAPDIYPGVAFAPSSALILFSAASGSTDTDVEVMLDALALYLRVRPITGRQWQWRHITKQETSPVKPSLKTQGLSMEPLTVRKQI